MPAVVLSGSILLLAPGLLASLALGAGRSVAEWILSGLALSLVVVSAVSAGVQQLLGSALDGGKFAAVVAGCAGVATVIPPFASVAERSFPRPLTRRNDWSTLGSVLVVPTLFLALQVPKVFWEDFNGDGLHAYEAARRLLTSPVPFLSASEAMTTYPGVRTALLSYPQGWYLRLFGESEASVRLPYIVFLAGLYAALLALIEYKRAAVVQQGERALLWAGVLIYAVVMAYSATYNPYHADIALPATQDTLLLALFLGFAVSQARGALGWACFFLVLTYTCSPAGVMLGALWLAANLLLVRPVPWRSVFVPALTLAICLVAERAVPAALLAAGLPAPGSEHGLSTLVALLSKIAFPPWRRVIFLLLPSGIAPAVALALWKRQDRIGRICTVVSVVSFVFFLVQKKSALHYYAPAMVLPLVTLWRLDVWARERWRRPALAAVSAGVLLIVPIHQAVECARRGWCDCAAAGERGKRRIDSSRLWCRTCSLRVVYGGHGDRTHSGNCRARGSGRPAATHVAESLGIEWIGHHWCSRAPVRDGIRTACGFPAASVRAGHLQPSEPGGVRLVGSPTPLRVATYNVHACVGRDGRYDPDRVATVIGELDADVVALQEFTYPASVALETRMPVVLTALDRYECALGPTRERTRQTVTECFGNALLTRHPIVEVHRLDLSMERRKPRGALAATLDVRGARLHVLATHLGLRVHERRFQVRQILDYLDSVRDAPAIVCGDFNDWLPADRLRTCSIAAWDARRVPPRFR